LAGKRAAIRAAWWIMLMIAALLLWISVNAARNAETNLRFAAAGPTDRPSAEPIGEAIEPGGGLKTYASDGVLEFAADLSAQLFAVTDLKSGIRWLSSPPTDGEAEVNELGKQIVASPLTVMYTKDGVDVQTAHLLAKKLEWRAYPIANGLQIRYRLPEIGIAFAAEFVLDQGALSVRIPEDSIEELPDAQITSISVFPFFGAAKQGDDGYMVIPDGSGGVTYFNRNHKHFVNDGYSKWIYGSDPTFEELDAPIIEQKLTLPVFGMVKDGGGFIAEIEEGAADARIKVSPPGVLSIPYYRGGFELVYRKSYISKLNNSGKLASFIEVNRITGDRTVRYDFVSGEDVGYADLAGVLRERYAAAWTETNAVGAPLIRMLAGVESRRDTLLQKLNVLTTFDEMIEVAEQLKQRGVNDFALQAAGWYKDGLYGDVPAKFPADGRFGGNEGLKRLLAWGNEHQVDVSLETNVIDIYHGDDSGVPLRTKAVREPGRELHTTHPLGPVGAYATSVNWHYASPGTAERQFVVPELDKLGELGARAVDVSHAGDMLFSDYNQAEPLHRIDTMQYYIRWLGMYRERVGSTGVYYGYGYAAQHADRILGIPIESSGSSMLDESIPFLQLVYHGLRDYYVPPMNRSDDPRRQLLRAVEYGAVPSFELTYRPSADLKWTFYNRLFSSYYEDWLPDVQEAYRAWEEAVKPVQRQHITDHRKVAENVYRTTYADGTEVWVNYGAQAAAVEGVTVEAMNFTVVPGEGGASS